MLQEGCGERSAICARAAVSNRLKWWSCFYGFAGYFLVQLQEPADLWAAQKLRQQKDHPEGLYPHLVGSLMGSILGSVGVTEYTLEESFVRTNPPPWAAAGTVPRTLALQEFKFDPPPK